MAKEKKNTIINDYEGEDLAIAIKNSEGKYKITNFDINYKLNCTIDEPYQSEFACQIDDKTNEISSTVKEKKSCYEGDKIVDLDEANCKIQGKDWKSSPNQMNHKLKITNKVPEPTAKKLTATITLETTFPYKTKLTGKLTVNFQPKQPVNLTIENDNNSYCDLVFSNQTTKDKTIQLAINTVMFQVDTSEDVGEIIKNSNNEINQIQLFIATANQRTVRLFKKDPSIKCTEETINYNLIK